MPLFFKQLSAVPAPEIIAHRLVWAVPLLLVIMAFRKQLGEFRSAICNWSSLRWMLVSAVLITTNWLVYVWAVNNGHILAASLGYYFNPLLNVLVGTLFLGERLNRTQWVAVAIACLAAVVLAGGAFNTMWISLSLAGSFCAYGVVRKYAPVGAIPGLAIETILLLPLAIGTIIWYANHGPAQHWTGDTTGDTRILLLLAAGGAITAIPLLLFATAARRMSYSALGFIQYIAPTLQLFVGICFYNEALSGARLAAFALIWCAIAIFSWDTVRRMRSAG
jgi:chloramphenicol-sensitive protein RarD